MRSPDRLSTHTPSSRTLSGAQREPSAHDVVVRRMGVTDQGTTRRARSTVERTEEQAPGTRDRSRDDKRAAEDAKLLEALRPRRRPLLLYAVLVNLVLALLGLGAPWVRGGQRADEGRARFARFSACLFQGRVAEEPGLVLPDAARAQLAGLFASAGPDWPARCRPALAAIAPREATFLFPKVKTAEAQVRGAVALVDRELEALEGGRGGGVRVPSRPWRAIQRLIGAMTIWMREVGHAARLEREAVSIAPPSLVEPMAAPLEASPSAALQLRADGPRIRALALDRTGISHLELGPEVGVVAHRIARKGWVRDVVFGPEHVYAISGLPEERCAEDWTACTHSATGVSRVGASRTLAAPVWLAAQPIRTSAAAIRVTGAHLDVVAMRDDEPAGEVRRFLLPLAPVSADSGDDTGTDGIADAQAANEARHGEANASANASEDADAAESTGDAPGAEDRPPRSPDAIRLLPDFSRDSAVAFAQYATDIEAVLYTVPTDAGHVLRRGAVPPQGSPETITRETDIAIAGSDPWVTSCDDGWVAWGAGAGLQLVRPDGSGSEVATLTRAPEAPSLLCLPSGVVLLLRVGEELWATGCDESRCHPPAPVLSPVEQYAAATVGEVAVIAAAGDRLREQVRVLTLGVDGVPRGEPTVPAPCWSHDGGLCGPPAMATFPEGVVLATVDGNRLALVVSRDGKRWTRPTGY